MILIELTTAVDSVGTLQTFYLSDTKFVTEPTDTPANTAFDPSLLDPGFIGLHAFSDGRTGGATTLETGEIVLSNIDGKFDAWLGYSFDGRPCTIRIGTSGAYPAAYTKVLSCTIEAIEVTYKQVVVRIRDAQYLFTLQACTALYGGTNALPNGIDGTPNDLQGKPKPRVFGQVQNASPAFVNTSKLIYQVNNGQVVDIPAVYVHALALTKGSDYANNTLLQGASPAAGTYITCVSEGLFRLGSTPSGIVTADVVQGSTAALRTAAQVLSQIAIAAGVSPSSISAADVVAMDAANSGVVGVYIDDTSSFASAMDSIANSVGAFYGFDATNTLRMGILTAPSGTPVVTLYDYDILDGMERRVPKDNGVAVWSVTVNYSKLFTVQANDYAGAVTAAKQAFLSTEFRSEAAVDATIKVKSLLAETMVVDTLLLSQSVAAAEASRLLALYNTSRSLFDVPVDISFVKANPLNFLNVVSIVLNRFGCNNGKSFRFIGVRIELAKNLAILTLWG